MLTRCGLPSLSALTVVVFFVPSLLPELSALSTRRDASSADRFILLLQIFVEIMQAVASRGRSTIVYAYATMIKAPTSVVVNDGRWSINVTANIQPSHHDVHTTRAAHRICDKCISPNYLYFSLFCTLKQRKDFDAERLDASNPPTPSRSAIHNICNKQQKEVVVSSSSAATAIEEIEVKIRYHQHTLAACCHLYHYIICQDVRSIRTFTALKLHSLTKKHLNAQSEDLQDIGPKSRHNSNISS